MTQTEPTPPAQSLRIDPEKILVDAHKVLHRLTSRGFDAYLVGGCVRDLLLGREPKDFDIATNARPRQIKRLFRNSQVIGRRFKLVHIRFQHRILEVSTFRAPPLKDDDDDDPYIKRDNVFGTEEQDAFRRDLTINGLFYDLKARRVIDHVRGLEDLAAKQIRMIGDPDERLREDPVRILRAAKFAGRLEFHLTPELAEAAKRHARDLEKASPARILEEFYRLLSNRGSSRSFRLLEELGALEVLIPELVPVPEFFYEALKKLEELSGGERGGVAQALMISVLLAPVARKRLAMENVADYEAAVDELLRPIGQRLTLSRRDITIARQCLAAQVRFMEPPEGRGAERFARREAFELALTLRELIGPLAEVDPDPLPLWQELAGSPGKAPKRARRGRRRRKRGGRHLRTKAEGGKDGSCPSPPASSSAPAPKKPPKDSPKDS